MSDQSKTYSPTSTPRLGKKGFLPSRTEQFAAMFRRNSSMHPDVSLRQRARRIMHSQWADAVVGCVVLFNIAIVIIEVDASGQGDTPAGWVTGVNHTLLAFYCLEIVVRFCVDGMDLFHDPYSVVDMFLVGFDLMMLATASSFKSSILRLARLAKITRTARLMIIVPQLHLMIKGLAGALGAILWGSLLAAFMTITWSILAVVWIHPINKDIAETTDIYQGCHRCAEAYSSVFQASLTFTQTIIAGDSWGHITLPIIEREPWTAIFFYMVFTSLALAAMNLILAVICDSAQQARHLSAHELALMKEVEMARSKKKLQDLCASMDADGNGLITLEEFENAYVTNEEFHDILTSLEIGHKEIELLFGLMDRDRSGEVSFEEYVNELWKMQSNDLHSMIIYIRFYVTEIRNQLVCQLDKLSDQIVGRMDLDEEILEKQVEQQSEYFGNGRRDETVLAAITKANEIKRIESNATKLVESKDVKFQLGRMDAVLSELVARLDISEKISGEAFASINASLKALTFHLQSPEADKTHLACPPLACFPEVYRRAPVQPRTPEKPERTQAPLQADVLPKPKAFSQADILRNSQASTRSDIPPKSGTSESPERSSRKIAYPITLGEIRQKPSQI